MSHAAHPVHPSFGYWALRVLFLLPIGLALVALAAWGLFGDSGMLLSDRAVASGVFLFVGLIALYPVFEAVRMNVFHRHQMILDEMTHEMLAHPAFVPKSEQESRRASRIFVIGSLVFMAYVFGAIVLGRDNAYSFSTALISVLWLGVFPIVLCADAYVFRHVHYQKHRVKIWLFKASFYAVSVLFLLIGAEAAMDWLNSEPVSMTVRFHDVSRDYCTSRCFMKCTRRVGATEANGKLRSFCLDRIRHNDVPRDVNRLLKGEAELTGRRSWAGVVVDNVVWRQTATKNPRP